MTNIEYPRLCGGTFLTLVIQALLQRKDNVNRPLETSISTIDGNIQEIRDTRSNRSAACRQLEDLQKECRLLIQDIHSENEAV